VTVGEWEHIAQRAHFCCEYCLSQYELSHDDFSIEHIIPTSKGGGDALGNLAFSCQSCNNHKYTFTEALDPATGVIHKVGEGIVDNPRFS
jgi:5-methylcytosine-specific restriction endonuclease McrA